MRKGIEKIDIQSLDLKDQVVGINRVTKVVKGGKNMSFAAFTVAPRFISFLRTSSSEDAVQTVVPDSSLMTCA